MTGTAASERIPRRNWGLYVGLAAVSVVTMPITAIWFVALGWLVAMVSCAVALVPRSDATRTRIVLTGFALAGGIFTGPTIYLGMALPSLLG